VDVKSIGDVATARISEAKKEGDLEKLLEIYDTKDQLLALAAKHLKNSPRAAFESWLTRVLRNDKAPAFVTAIKKVLPPIQAS
jgi:hypothetical protein